MAVTIYTANGNNSAIKVRKVSRKVLLSNCFRFNKKDKTYVFEDRLAGTPGCKFYFCIYPDGEWIIRVYDQYGIAHRYKDVLRDLVDSTLDEYRQAILIDHEVELIMSWLSDQGIITGHVPGAII